MMTSLWEPFIHPALDNGTVLASFSPWDPSATFVKMCLVEMGGSTCEGTFILTQNQTHARFTDVPCNKTFIIKLRSYNAEMTPLQKFYWDSTTDVMLPCPLNMTVANDGNYHHSEPIVIGMVCVIAFFLVVAGIFFFWLKKSSAIKSEFDRYLVLFRSPQTKTSTITNNQHILPAYISESQAYEQAVHAHIHLLKSIVGLNIHTYEEQRTDIQKHKYAWAETNLARCTAVLIYHSPSVNDVIKGRDLPDDCSAYGEVCRDILRQTEKLNKTIVHVTLYGGESAVSVKDTINLVQHDNDKVRVINFDKVVKKLTKVKSHNIPSEEDTFELCQYVSELYGTTVGHTEDHHIENLPLLSRDGPNIQADDDQCRMV